MSPETLTTSYDSVLYPSYVHTQMHPDRLATLATLYGLSPKAVPTSRILELGCGQGGNLIPLAVSFPESDCWGIDLSERQIASGQRVVDSLGLKNIRLLAKSILNFPEDAGTFDYIVVHGVFSWVPIEVRQKILDICQQHLADEGVALISYNTYPGWHQRRMIRDMMRFHTKSFTEPAKQIEQAKAFLTFMTKAIPEESAYGKSLHEEYHSLANAEESYLFHEQLEEINDPLYFHEFATLASQYGLQYLSEIELSNLQLQRYPTQVASVLANMAIIEREQYLDFLMRRTFRQTLLCRQGVEVDRVAMAKQVTKLRVSCRALASGQHVGISTPQPFTFNGPGGIKITVGDLMTKAAFVRLGQAWPNSIPFSELQSLVRKDVAGGAIVVQSQEKYESDTIAMAEHLWQSFVAGLIQLHTIPPTYCTELSERPKACPLARFQAAQGDSVTTRLHQTMKLDPLTCCALSNLDGDTSLDQLLDRLVHFVSQQNMTLQHDGEVVSGTENVRQKLNEKLTSNLELLCRSGLLVY